MNLLIFAVRSFTFECKSVALYDLRPSLYQTSYILLFWLFMKHWVKGTYNGRSFTTNHLEKKIWCTIINHIVCIRFVVTVLMKVCSITLWELKSKKQNNGNPQQVCLWDEKVSLDCLLGHCFPGKSHAADRPAFRYSKAPGFRRKQAEKKKKEELYIITRIIWTI